MLKLFRLGALTNIGEKMSEKKLTPEEEQKLNEQINADAKKVSEDDLKKLLAKADQVKDKTTKLPEGFWSDITLMWSLISDYYNRVYREIPWTSIAMIIVAIIYLINPIDLIPDFIPIIGYIDDATVIALTLKAIKSDLNAYRKWKEAQV
jgi:uncharacterized membrane protein YkvA (DUF1232 family)